MEHGTPHAKFDLAKKLFTQWATQQKSNFALPTGRVESWPLDVRCKVQSVTKGMEVMLCGCGKVTSGGPFCSDVCQKGRCKTCHDVLTFAPGPFAEIPSKVCWEYAEGRRELRMREMLAEHDIEWWKQDFADKKRSCWACSRFEEDWGEERGCQGGVERGCHMNPCDKCIEFKEMFLDAPQKCDMCHFHIFQELLFNLASFSCCVQQKQQLELSKLRQRFNILENECNMMTKKRESILICPTCPPPAKKQRL